MTIYIDNGDTVKIYPAKEKVVKAIETLLELDDNLVWSETHAGYGVAIIDKAESGKQVDFIKADARLDKIRAKINGMYRVILKGTPKDDWAVRWNDCLDEVLQVIDKYRESEDING